MTKSKLAWPKANAEKESEAASDFGNDGREKSDEFASFAVDGGKVGILNLTVFNEKLNP